MARVLVILVHPTLHKSRINDALAREARQVVGVRLHDLYAAWPDHDIEPAPEQALLSEHDVVVLQHPFYWYSSPSLLKEWFDLVLTFGWAYGPGGTALRGKLMVSALSTGGPAEAYVGGGERYALRELLAPVDQTAWLCGMRYSVPFVTHAAHRLDAAGIAAAAARYRATLEALVDGYAPPTLRAAPTDELGALVAREGRV
jgi:glutathione-regulated potassium-efflux system ancillary protein KefG